MPTLPQWSELFAYSAGLWNGWLAGAAIFLAVMGGLTFFVPRWNLSGAKRHGGKIAVALLIVAQFGAYQGSVKARLDDVARLDMDIQELKAEVARLDALLHPDIQAFIRDPESWFWEGVRYPQDARIKLDETARIAMRPATPQRLNLTVVAPLSQALSRVVVFLVFPRPVMPLPCDPNVQVVPPAWTPSNGNAYYTTISAINPGGSTGPYEAFCFSVDTKGLLPVRYQVSPSETAPFSGEFTIRVSDTP